MPSQTAIVLNSKGVPPAARMPSFTASPNRAEVDVSGNDVCVAVSYTDQWFCYVIIL